ncbi:hypothetical protein [Emticicia sp.]
MNTLFNAIDNHPFVSISILAVIVGMVWLFYEIDNAPISDDDNF